MYFIHCNPAIVLTLCFPMWHTDYSQSVNRCQRQDCRPTQHWKRLEDVQQKNLGEVLTTIGVIMFVNDLKASGTTVTWDNISSTICRNGLKSCSTLNVNLLKKAHVQVYLKFASEHLNAKAWEKLLIKPKPVIDEGKCCVLAMWIIYIHLLTRTDRLCTLHIFDTQLHPRTKAYLTTGRRLAQICTPGSWIQSPLAHVVPINKPRIR